MIISHSRKFVFVKTKKTAGTSIECALAPHLEPGDLASPLVEHEPQYRRFSKEFVRILREKDSGIRARNPHLPASVVSRHFSKETEGYYSFCVERNPWDKAISAFFFWISKHPVDPSRPDEENFLEFAQSERLSFFSDFDAYMLSGKPQVDRILSFESLAEEFSEVAASIGLPDITIGRIRAKGEIRPKNAHSLEQFYGADLDNLAAKRVRSVFAREIEYFGYAL
ncbi:sulfotransferase family 2 domain-containing protein [Roseovarius arcticus]|uniref:sulfotransferase family 2 domain-containing protein n=1 Tax=Roseovarius arcticus TaxID=2547404 RepID=UPI00111052B9|nr:sulfotransferase family 2 domain-containing protein [Roseovarius arcticus]